MGWITMSERELQRVEVLGEVLNGRRGIGSAASVLALSERQVWRLLARYAAQVEQRTGRRCLCGRLTAAVCLLSVKPRCGRHVWQQDDGSAIGGAVKPCACGAPQSGDGA